MLNVFTLQSKQSLNFSLCKTETPYPLTSDCPRPPTPQPCWFLQLPHSWQIPWSHGWNSWCHHHSLVTDPEPKQGSWCSTDVIILPDCTAVFLNCSNTRAKALLRWEALKASVTPWSTGQIKEMVFRGRNATLRWRWRLPIKGEGLGALATISKILKVRYCPNSPPFLWHSDRDGIFGRSWVTEPSRICYCSCRTLAVCAYGCAWQRWAPHCARSQPVSICSLQHCHQARLWSCP